MKYCLVSNVEQKIEDIRSITEQFNKSPAESHLANNNNKLQNNKQSE